MKLKIDNATLSIVPPFDWQTDWSGVGSDADAKAIRHGEEGAAPDSHLWSSDLGRDQRNKVADSRGRNEFSLQGDWALPEG